MTTPNRALILVDIQQEYFNGPLEIQYPPHSDSLPKIVAAIDAAAETSTPTVVVQHTSGDESPVFNPTTKAFSLHPAIEQRREQNWKAITKQFSSVFAGTDLLSWLEEKSIDTITLVGYMTNNCIIASAVEAERYGISVEVLSDATGAISIGNAAGYIDAETVHTTLMAVLNSNLAAVEPTDGWIAAVRQGHSLPKDNLANSGMSGAERFPKTQ